MGQTGGERYKTIKNMKPIKLLALIVCAAALVAGCATKKCCSAETATAACGMKCCTDSKASCATCPTCTAKK